MYASIIGITGTHKSTHMKSGLCADFGAIELSAHKSSQILSDWQ